MNKVFFDYRYIGGVEHTIEMCVVVTDEYDNLFIEDMKQVAGLGTQAKYNLDYSLMAFDFALDVIKENDFEEATFYNQNNLIFNWVNDIECTARTILNPLRSKLVMLIEECEFTIAFSSVESTKNKAKKLLNKQKKTNATKGSFESLLNSYGKVKTEENLTVKKAAKVSSKQYKSKYSYKSKQKEAGE